jgi:hypothetical protein
MNDGHPNANICLQEALRTLQRQKKRKTVLHLKKAKTYPESVLRITQHLTTTPRKIKPYGICVAVPVYIPYIPGTTMQKLVGQINHATATVANNDASSPRVELSTLALQALVLCQE